MNISILILTLDEEVNLDDCLHSVSWSNDVVVLDSGSGDKTGEIARAHGARVIVRSFDNYAAQRNFGLREIPYQNAWVLMLDADERVPQDLHQEMTQRVAAALDNIALFRMRRRDHLFGRWIKRASGYPTWFGRLARLGHVWVERPINEQYCTNGAVEELSRHLDHFPFNKGFSAWLQKHDRYSSAEARLLEDRQRTQWRFSALLDRDADVRRRNLKALLYSLPGRSGIVFVALYFWRGAILEGRAGFTFCALRAFYEFMIDCKREELRCRQSRRPV